MLSPLEPDTVLSGRYRVERLLGRGGMGAVYLAKDNRFDRRVAVKQSFHSDNSYGRAFERDARLLNGLRHPQLPGPQSDAGRATFNRRTAADLKKDHGS